MSFVYYNAILKDCGLSKNTQSSIEIDATVVEKHMSFQILLKTM